MKFLISATAALSLTAQVATTPGKIDELPIDILDVQAMRRDEVLTQTFDFYDKYDGNEQSLVQEEQKYLPSFDEVLSI